MRRMVLSVLAILSLSAAAPALAQPAPPPGSIADREARLAAGIERAARKGGGLAREEAARLRTGLRRVQRLERYYRRHERLSIWERRDLERRLDKLAARLAADRRTGERRR